MRNAADPGRSALMSGPHRNTTDERYRATRFVFRRDRRDGLRVRDTADVLAMLGLDLDEALTHERATYPGA